MTTAQFLSTAATLQACADLRPRLKLPELYTIMEARLKANPNYPAADTLYTVYRKGVPAKDMSAYMDNLGQLNGLSSEVLLYALYNFAPDRSDIITSANYKKLHKAIIANNKALNYHEQNRLERNYNPKVKK